MIESDLDMLEDKSNSKKQTRLSVLNQTTILDAKQRLKSIDFNDKRKDSLFAYNHYKNNINTSKNFYLKI